MDRGVARSDGDTVSSPPLTIPGLAGESDRQAEDVPALHSVAVRTGHRRREEIARWSEWGHGEWGWGWGGVVDNWTPPQMPILPAIHRSPSAVRPPPSAAVRPPRVVGSSGGCVVSPDHCPVCTDIWHTPRHLAHAAPKPCVSGAEIWSRSPTVSSARAIAPSARSLCLAEEG